MEREEALHQLGLDGEPTRAEVDSAYINHRKALGEHHRANWVTAKQQETLAERLDALDEARRTLFKTERPNLEALFAAPEPAIVVQRPALQAPAPSPAPLGPSAVFERHQPKRSFFSLPRVLWFLVALVGGLIICAMSGVFDSEEAERWRRKAERDEVLASDCVTELKEIEQGLRDEIRLANNEVREVENKREGRWSRALSAAKQRYKDATDAQRYFSKNVWPYDSDRKFQILLDEGRRAKNGERYEDAAEAFEAAADLSRKALIRYRRWQSLEP